MAHLRFPNSDKAPVTLGDKLVVGRSEDQAGLVIDDKRLSRKHCEFVRVADQWLVRDLGSANGVRVNSGDKVKEHTLKDGDVVSLGGYLLSFHEGAPAPDGNKAVLRVIKGSLAKVTYLIEPLPFTIGRREGCEMVLEGDGQASGNHARISRTGGEWTIVDLGSTNGTKVDGRDIRDAVLRDGAQIAVGSALLRFQLVADSGVAADKSIDDQMDDLGDDIDLESDDSIKQTNKIPPNAKTVFMGGKDPMPPKVMPDAPTARLAKTEVEELDLGSGDDSNGDGVPDEKETGPKVNQTGSGAGRGVVIAVEVAVALVILGALGWFLMQLMDTTAEGPTGLGGGKVRLVPKGGGLLIDSPADGRGNYSFELDDGASTGIPSWVAIESTPFDMVSPLPDDGKSGHTVLRIQRFQGTHLRTVVECDKFIEVTPGKPYTGSVWVKRGSTGDGSAFLTMRWFTAKGEAAPVRADSLGFAPGTAEWAEVSATFVAPAGARAGRFGVGYAGKLGELHFDQANLVEAASGGPVQASAGTGALIRLDAAARLSVANAQGQPMLTQGHFLLSSAAPDRGTLLHSDWMVTAPVVTGESWTFTLFDPDTESTRTIVVKPGASGLSLEARAVSGSSYGSVVLRTHATQALLPEGSSVAMYQRNSLAAWATTHNTRDACELRITDSQTMATITTSGGYRQQAQVMEFMLPDGNATIGLSFPGVPTALRELMALVRRDSDRAVTNAERLTAGLMLAVDGLLDGEALTSATDAVEGSETEWRIRERELSDTIDAGAVSARDAQRFLAAVDEADVLATTIATNLPTWQAAIPKVSELSRITALPRERSEKLRRILSAVQNLDRIRADLVGIKARGEAQAFLLRAERQRIAAIPVIASALDHFATAEPVQAQIKFISVIENFPHTRAATRARLRLLDLAAAQLVERDAHKAAGLPNMAAEAALKARKMVELVLTTSRALDAERTFEKLKAGGSRRPEDIEDWEREQREAADRATAMMDALNKG